MWSPGALGHDLLDRVRTAVRRAVIGYADAVRALAIALLSDGHVLLEGVPGLAKTYLVRTFSDALDLSFRRIQFTPDMLPSDITGTSVLNQQTQQFEFRPGPVFSHVVLADEINRAPPKVQSALLEAMQERQVTVDGRTYPLPRPFMVIATENPIEQEGTYPLPEAELDRFLFRWVLGYPTAEEEVAILTTRDAVMAAPPVRGVITPAEVDLLRQATHDVYVSRELLEYLTRVIRETRRDPRLVLGASPRASVQFLFAARASAILDGRRYVIPDDIRDLAFGVLNHRVLVRPEAMVQAAGASQTGGPLHRLREIVREVVDRIDVPR
jgi:MoxR-like ATPase